MTRFALTEVLLFLAPFLLYGVWMRLGGRDPFTGDAWRGRRFYLAVAGLLLALVSFFVLAEFSGEPPGSVYVPPRYEDGRVVPGHFERPGTVR